MALTAHDISTIRDTIIDALEALIIPRLDEHDARFDRIDNEFKALRSDVMLLQRRVDEMAITLDTVEGKVEALENDIKEIYGMLESYRKAPPARKAFLKLKLRDKILQTNDLLLITAKEAKVTLPRP